MHSELNDEQYRLLQTFNDLAAGSPTTDITASDAAQAAEFDPRSPESETYLGLLIMAAFWAVFSGAVVAVSEREASQREALGWVASFAAASLVAALCFGLLL